MLLKENYFELHYAKCIAVIGNSEKKHTNKELSKIIYLRRKNIKKGFLF